MRQHIPVGHHTAEEVVELLGLRSKRWLLQRLREMGWLITDKNGVRSGRHNLPRREVIQAGLANTVTCSYGTGPAREITRQYDVVIFTPLGLETLKSIFKDGAPPPDLNKKTPPPEPEKPRKLLDLKKSEEARQRSMKALRAMGIF